MHAIVLYNILIAKTDSSPIVQYNKRTAPFSNLSRVGPATAPQWSNHSQYPFPEKVPPTQDPPPCREGLEGMVWKGRFWSLLPTILEGVGKRLEKAIPILFTYFCEGDRGKVQGHP